MIYTAIFLYLAGCYMQLHLGQRIMKLENDDSYEIAHMVVASIFWPISACFFLVRRIIGAA